MTDFRIARPFAISLAALAIGLILSASAQADAVAEAKGVNDAFTEAAEACDIPAVMDLYEDNAVVIWPGQGEFCDRQAGVRENPQGILRRVCEAVAQSNQQRRAPGRPGLHHSLRTAR
jgi:hypothetical protein